MNNKLTNQPPKWANRFLEWYCRHDLLEDLQGDLYEHFDRNLSSKGLRSAKITYWLDVIKFCKPYTIRKFKIIKKREKKFIRNFYSVWAACVSPWLY